MYQNRSYGTARQYLLTLLVLIFVSIWIFGASGTGSGVSLIPTSNVIPEDRKAVLYSLADSFSAIAQRAETGVVSITAVQNSSPTASPSSNRGTDGEKNLPAKGNGSAVTLPGQRTAGSLMPSLVPDIPVRASGSGTIVRRDGSNFYILTNYHVVEGAYQVGVRLLDDTDLKGIVVGVDPYTDLAVVRISSPVLTDANIVPMGDSDTVKVGSWALAVGSPFGFEHTLTVGVVSALHRQLDEEDAEYPDLIQTDAAINKGNSGGPLLDIDGRVIGINAAIASPTGGFIGLGFAIPVNTAKQVLDDLITKGYVVRGWLGVSVQELNSVLKQYYGVDRGVLVTSVDSDGPAAKAGIASEDVVVSIGDMQATDVKQLQERVSAADPGTIIPVTVVRDGRLRTLQAKVGLSPGALTSRPTPPPTRGGTGVDVRTLSSSLARGLGLSYTTGVIVVDVVAGSAADDAGLEEGDIVVRFNGKTVGDEDAFKKMLNSVGPGGMVVLKVVRKSSERILGFQMDQQ